MNAKTYGKLVNGEIEAEETLTVVSVELNRAEGPSELCGERSYNSIEEANAAIQMWAAGMPEDQLGYDKVDFVVNFSNGDNYEGRFDMKYSHKNGVSLKKQMVETIRWFIANPAYLTAAELQDTIKALPLYEAL